MMVLGVTKGQQGREEVSCNPSSVLVSLCGPERIFPFSGPQFPQLLNKGMGSLREPSEP